MKENLTIEVEGDTWFVTSKKNSKWFSVGLVISGVRASSPFTGIDKEACLQFIWSRYNKIEPLKVEDLKEI